MTKFFAAVTFLLLATSVFAAADCVFQETEREWGTVVRVQAYNPPIAKCGIVYLGKVTIKNEETDEKYLAFVTEESVCFGKSSEAIKCPGQEIDPETGKRLIGKIKKGWVAEYGFKEREFKDRIPKNEHGLLDDFKFLSVSNEGD